MAFVLDPAGGAEVLKDLVADEIAALAEQVSAAAGEGAQVKLSTTDRARASVSVPADAQAKDGVLSRAAAAVGLEIRPSKKSAPKKRTQTKRRKRKSN
jgi:hypothetical protein